MRSARKLGKPAAGGLRHAGNLEIIINYVSYKIIFCMKELIGLI